MSQSTCVFNSDVILYALQRHLGKTAPTPDLAEMWELSHALILLQPTIRVSATAWLEVIWTLRADERAEASRSFESRISDDATTLEVVKIASDLAATHRTKPAHCPRCWGTDEDRPCTRCERVVCREDRRNDLIILASAIANRENGVETLYTFDGQHLAYRGSPIVRGLEIVKPSSPAQAVLPAIPVAPNQIVQAKTGAKKKS